MPVERGPSGTGGTARVVGDVTDEHRGWYLRVTDPSRPSGYDYFTLGKGFGSGVRAWTCEGVEMVGLTDDQRSPGIVGTEHIYRADTPCELLRQVKSPRKKVARAR